MLHIFYDDKYVCKYNFSRMVSYSKDVRKGAFLSPYLFNLCTECIIWKTGVDSEKKEK